MNRYQIIKIEDFIGQKHFRLFSKYSDPTYSLTTIVDLTAFYRYAKKHGYPIYLSLVYLITKALNQITAFCYRFDGENILLFDRIDPGFTVMTDMGVYDNCDDIDIHSDFHTFLQEAVPLVAEIKKGTYLSGEQIDVRLDKFYFSSLPWMEFTSLTQPIDNGPLAYIPRIAWDKFHFEDDKITMHLNFQVHHALIEGVHLGQAITQIQKYLNEPELILER
ncbi:MAG: CatA-like O-acetyltransferase [Bacilli bacterium]|jgi:chloramphenicol O-acetyltransferase type A